MTFSYLNFYAYLKHQNKTDFVVLYTSLALAKIAKGPVALGLCGSGFLLYLIWSPSQLKINLKKLNIPIGAMVYLIIVLPWFILVAQAT